MIKKIFHISDIHIRLYRRAKQYLHVLQNLLTTIEERMDQHSIAVVTGDIFHSKNELSPEAIAIASGFFQRLLELLPVILIAGNHDTNLANSNRLDSLSPIVQLIEDQNLFYLKNTGWYEHSNLNIWVSSVFDQRLPKTFPKNDSINILLYHGCVGNVVVNGIPLPSTYKIQEFKGFDFVLLGDIHKQQILSKNPLTAYAGSLMQLNFGQQVDKHGILVWDLQKKQIESVEIPNDYSYYNIIVKDGQIEEMPEIKAKHPRIKIKYTNTTMLRLKEIKKELYEKYHVEQLMLIRQSEDLVVRTSTFKYQLQNLQNPKYQQQVIKQYIEHMNLPIQKQELKKVLILNQEINSVVNSSQKKKFHQNLWTVQKLEFDNFFSYGQGNVVEFNTHKGIVAILGENRAGKSSIIDTLMFLLYDKTSRCYKSISVLNNKKDKLWGKVTLMINGKPHAIQRWGKLKHSASGDSLPIKCKFYAIQEDGTQVDLSGTDRFSTNAIIQQYVGVYDDAVATFFSTQGNANAFIQLTNSGRKSQLNSLLNLSIFDDCYSQANERSKYLKGYLNNVEIEKIENDLKINNQNIIVLSESIKNLEDSIKKVCKEIDKKEKILKELNSEKRKQNQEIIDIEQIKTNIKKQKEQKASLTAGKLSVEKKKNALEENLKQLEVLIQKVKIGKKKQHYESLQSDYLQYQGYLKQLQMLNSDIAEKQKKLELLKEVEYDENCPYCMNNPLTKDAISTQKKMSKWLQKRKELKEDIAKIKPAFDKRNQLEGEIRLFESEVLPLHNSLMKEDSQLSDDWLDYEEKIRIIDNKLSILEQKQKAYYDNQIIIQQNTKLHKQIMEIEQLLHPLIEERKELENQLLKNRINISNTQQSIENGNIAIRQYNEKNQQLQVLQKYKLIVGRTGLQYYITSNIIVVLQNEMNAVLEMIANFSVQFVIQGKQVHINIVYSDKTYPVETCSGFEKFIISIALRHTLSSITNKSKAKMFVIDEGFGVLDNENVNAFQKIFNFIAQKYQTLVVISHLQAMKPMFQDAIQVQYNDGVSMIYESSSNQ